jgi:NDP-sugar pyrophosphorylase family protein
MFLNKDQSEGFEFGNKFKTLNFYKLSKELVEDFFIDRMEDHINSKDVNSYYEWIIQEAINSGYLFYGQKAGNHKWWEIDTYEDLLKAESIFKELKESN